MHIPVIAIASLTLAAAATTAPSVDPGMTARLDQAIDRAIVSKRIVGTVVLVARDGASDEDRLKIADANASRMRRFSEIAKSNGTTMEQVQRRHAEKMRERIAAGSGVWYQAEDGSWRQK